MSTITKQAVQAVADLKAGYTLGHADVAILNELARIALASLEAEAAITVGDDGGDALAYRRLIQTFAPGTKLYTAPPAPANSEPVAWLWSHRKHPSEVTLVRPEDDERAEGDYWSGWSCHALYAAQPEPVSVPDEVCWEDVPEEITEDDMALASAWAHGFNQCRAAMLQGAERVTTANKLPDGWVACSERLPPEGYETDGGAICYLVWHKNEVDCGPQYSISNVFFLRKHWEKNFTHWMPLPAAPQRGDSF